ncbi:MFS transporter [Glaciibacter sp. 2TAF33]|uniref:MFS transporter n=1 Tax=Glaciibacter sp. 2TAF33 TaxID=3233015 RepID=UPI003F92CFAB
MSAIAYLATATPLRMASGGSIVAIPILAVERFGDVALGGALVAASLAPSILAAPLAGVALDRTSHPRWLIAGAGVVTAAAFVTAAFLGAVPLPLVFGALIAAGTVTPFFMGGLSSFATEAIPDERRAYANDALSYNLGAVAGPAIVATAATVGSAQLAMLLLAGGALLGAIATVSIRLSALAVTTGSIWTAMRAGLTHIATHRPLALVTASGTLSQLGNGGLAISAVALSLERAGSPDAGAVIVSAAAIGGLLGALAIAARQGRMPPERVMGLGFAATGLFTVAAAINFGLVWSIVAIGLSGLFTASSSAAMLLLRKQQSPLAYRSQVFTVGAGLRATASAAGAALAGAAAAAGLSAGVLIMGVGIAWIASALLLIAYPRNAPPIDGK